jgi:hypothetical protein
MPGFGENTDEEESQCDAGARQRSRRSFFARRYGFTGVLSGASGSRKASGQRQNEKCGDGPRRFVHGESKQPAGEDA